MIFLLTYVYNNLLMQDYQLFWNNQINREAYLQLVIDWDVFINNFTETIAKYTHYELNQTQKEFIKAKIDPQQRNQIYKNAFLIFTNSYWDIPSNRTNLFKMKMNLTNVLPRFNQIDNILIETINIKIKYNTQKQTQNLLEYQLKDNILHQKINDDLMKELPIKEKGFLSIGSNPKNDISIGDCIYMNSFHMKLISVLKQKKVQKKISYFDQKKQQPMRYRQWYIRDVSRSNRLRYLLEHPFKYVFAKPHLVITLGMTEDYQVLIQQIGYGTEDFIINSQQEEKVINLLNADRLNFMGQIDPNVPLKTILNISNQQINAKQVEMLYNDGLYYPQTKDQVIKAKSKDTPAIHLTVVNKRTLKSWSHTMQASAFTIGRSKESTIRIDDMAIKSKELQFQCVNNLWIINNPEARAQHTLNINAPSVYLATARLREQSKISNRIQLKQGHPFLLSGKNFQISLQLIEPITKEDDY